MCIYTYTHVYIFVTPTVTPDDHVKWGPEKRTDPVQILPKDSWIPSLLPLTCTGVLAVGKHLAHLAAIPHQQEGHPRVHLHDGILELKCPASGRRIHLLEGRRSVHRPDGIVAHPHVEHAPGLESIF